MFAGKRVSITPFLLKIRENGKTGDRIIPLFSWFAIDYVGGARCEEGMGRGVFFRQMLVSDASVTSGSLEHSSKRGGDTTGTRGWVLKPDERKGKQRHKKKKKKHKKGEREEKKKYGEFGAAHFATKKCHLMHSELFFSFSRMCKKRHVHPRRRRRK